MEWADGAMTYLRSATSIDGSDSTANRLAVGPLAPGPTIGGLAPGALLLAVWIDDYDGDIVPNGVAVFSEGPIGWNAGATITTASLLEYLETTTDYEAAQPNGPPLVTFNLAQFDGAAGPLFVAGVLVSDYFDPEADTFEAEVECRYAVPLDCLLLSDDGVLRPGDEGEAVGALQENLAATGYYAGAVDGEYGPGTTAAVREFQRDHRLTIDGRAGPNTLTLIEELVSGRSDIVMASQDGIGEVLFGVEDNTAYAGLIGVFGTPDSTTGWYVDACDGHDWFKANWGGFNAIFTDREGFRQLDGWEVTDISDIPGWLYFKGGVAPGWTWSDLDSMGAGFDPTYGAFWYQHDLGYNNGRFTAIPATDPPPADAELKSFGTGTGAFVSC